ncbi:TonB-dependent receptor plug domain-containing protein [Hugenholtzia roseola]|uniref:TonB-dependent receptor plug domain-containing protein n=1 Tax=Hugenholtzia roseola TaxID=1002 RepID=UPI001B7FD2AD|nr:TonB-dependent receptor [Hugenholtzia roseola]
MFLLWGLSAIAVLSAQDQQNSNLYQFSLEDFSNPTQSQKSVTVASNLLQSSEKQPASVTTISRQWLHTSGARTLSEALMLFVPGFFLVEDQDDVIAGFRGLAPDNNSKVLLLINGQSLNTEFFWGPADAILNSANFDYIERIEVIRGAGSVTLGQGALLGVINIITRQGNDLNNQQSLAQGSMNIGVGQNTFLHGSADVQVNTHELKSYFYLSTNRYEGQTLRREGWTVAQNNQGYAGGQVADIGLRLKRAENVTMVGVLSYKDFTLNALHTNQTRDLYNFFRDRNVFNQSLTAITGSYRKNLTARLLLQADLSYQKDLFALYSVVGTAMGGTREDRFGGKILLTANEWIAKNKIAIGAEVKRFEMGKANAQNNNFIANVIGTFDPITANDSLTMGFRKDIHLISLFAENLYSPNDKLDLFAALRYDNHPFWGNNLSPRVGAIYSPKEKWQLRLSYQAGFRGAVGLHYTGGYRLDGFLRAENYNRVETAAIGGAGQDGLQMERNIPTTLPERMHNIEAALSYQISSSFQFNTVLFFNRISNVIDVGVIYRDPNQMPLTAIGTDVAGDWNGFWFFKNTPGAFNQIGAESTLSYQNKAQNLSLRLSQAWVRVLGATQAQRELAQNQNSMYLAANESGELHFKAYPENIIRAHLHYKPMKKLGFALHALWYSRWYSPIGSVSEGGLLFNAGLNWEISTRLTWTLNVKNLLNMQSLYPMNSNAGGPDVSPGTPAWEGRTLWANLRLLF